MEGGSEAPQCKMWLRWIKVWQPCCLFQRDRTLDVGDPTLSPPESHILHSPSFPVSGSKKGMLWGPHTFAKSSQHPERKREREFSTCHKKVCLFRPCLFRDTLQSSSVHLVVIHLARSMQGVRMSQVSSSLCHSEEMGWEGELEKWHHYYPINISITCSSEIALPI